MSYGNNLIINGDAETGNLTGWTSSNATVVSGGSGAGPYCFRLASTAHMYQQVAQVDFIINPKEYRVALDFLFQNAIDPLVNDASLLVIVTLHYFGGTQDEYVYSLLEDFNDSQIYGADTWYTFECTAPLSINSVLTAVTLRVETVAATGYCQIDNIELNRSQTELEVQLRMEPTEQLPLSIAVDQTGIRGWRSDYNTPNFWLKDSGEFAFINEAADSHFIFNGTDFEFKGKLIITGGSGLAKLTDAGDLALKDTIGAIDCDTTIISGGKIITGLLTASNIQTGTLTGITIQTAFSGARLVLTENRLRGYNGSGQLHGAELDPTSTWYSSALNMWAAGWNYGRLNALGSGMEVWGDEYLYFITGSTSHISLSSTGISLNSAVTFNSAVYNLVTDSDTHNHGGSTGNDTTAAHNHGIPNGTNLALAGGGSITWVAYTGGEHSHSISNDSHSHAVQKS